MTHASNVLLGPALLDSLDPKTGRQDVHNIIRVACHCVSIFECWSRAYAKRPSLINIITQVQAHFTAFHKTLSDSVKTTESSIHVVIDLRTIVGELLEPRLSPEDVKAFIERRFSVEDIEEASQKSNTIQHALCVLEKEVEATAKKTGEGKLDSNNPETKKLVAKMFRNKTNFLKIPYLTMISLPPPIDFHVQVIKDTSRTHENTRVNKPKEVRYEAAVATLNTLGTLLGQLATCIGRFHLHWMSNSQKFRQLLRVISQSVLVRLELQTIERLLKEVEQVYSEYASKIEYLLALAPPTRASESIHRLVP